MASLREITVVADQGLTITVTESLELRAGGTNRGRFATAILKPTKVVVKTPDGTSELDIDTSAPDSLRYIDE